MSELKALAGYPCTNRDHAWDGSQRDADGRCAKCDAILHEVRRPDYSVFYEWCVENAPRVVELCPYKFSVKK